MRIGLDLDGAIYQFDKTAHYMMAMKLGYRLRENMPWYVNEYWRGVDKDVWDWLWQDEQVDPLFRHGHLYRGAIEFVYELATLGEVSVITTRPESARKVTNEWLKFHWGEPNKPWPFRDVHLIHEGPKSVVPVDIMIDDRTKVLAQFEPPVTRILIDRPHNKLEAWQSGIDRAYSYEGVLKIVRGSLRP